MRYERQSAELGKIPGWGFWSWEVMRELNRYQRGQITLTDSGKDTLKYAKKFFDEVLEGGFTVLPRPTNGPDATRIPTFSKDAVDAYMLAVESWSAMGEPSPQTWSELNSRCEEMENSIDIVIKGHFIDTSLLSRTESFFRQISETSLAKTHRPPTLR